MILRLLSTHQLASSHQAHYRCHRSKALPDRHKVINEAGQRSTTRTSIHASQWIPVVKWAPWTTQAACSRPH